MINLNRSNSGIIWKKLDGRKKLYTKIETSTHEYRNWNPFRSKLGAALFNGLEIFPFESGSKIFYSDTTTDTTLNHISDIIGPNGKISVDKFNKNSEKFDIVYLKISDNRNLETEIFNYESHLKNSGFLIIFLNNSSNTIDSSFQNLTTKIINNSKMSFQLIQEINLADFFKNHMMILLQKTETSLRMV
jgi:fibrillarin-like rRNA methylase